MSPEPESNTDSGNGAAVPGRVPSAGRPAKPQRRQFSADLKTRIVEEADACTEAGEVTALLRREGLYSSHLANWRRQYRSGAAAGLAQRRGPKGKDPLVAENEALERQVARLQHRLQHAEKIIEVQKKLSELLGIPMPDSSDR
jgi:transposase-like protein